MRVIHLLHRSIPGTHGYATRSKVIVEQQAAKGLTPLVVTSPSQSPAGELDKERSEVIGGVRYFRTCGRMLPPSTDVNDGRPLRSMLRIGQNVFFLQRVFSLARKYKPAVIHAHSPFTCGIIANLVGGLLGVPTIYEMRGIWEDSHASRHGLSERSFRYRALRRLETMALNRADLCFVICQALRQEVVSRSIPAEKVVVVPNGVDAASFVPGPPDPELQTSLGLGGKRVMGYVGTFFHYEGLALLVRALAALKDEFSDLRLLMVGGGELTPELRRVAEELGVSDRLVFTGVVPHDRITEYYRLFDLMILPRLETRETRLVTPLKPLEIMGMGKPLAASDIGGHREIVINGENGLLFRSEDVDDLVSVCRGLLSDPEKARELGAAGRKWVAAHRDWNVLIDKYVEIYQKISDDIQRGE